MLSFPGEYAIFYQVLEFYSGVFHVICSCFNLQVSYSFAGEIILVLYFCAGLLVRFHVRGKG